MALQGSAEVVRLDLHAEFPPEVLPYLLGRHIVTERGDCTHRGLPQWQGCFRRSLACSAGSAAPGRCRYRLCRLYHLSTSTAARGRRRRRRKPQQHALRRIKLDQLLGELGPLRIDPSQPLGQALPLRRNVIQHGHRVPVPSSANLDSPNRKVPSRSAPARYGREGSARLDRANRRESRWPYPWASPSSP